MKFEHVTLDMLGRGGTEDDEPLAEEVSRAIGDLAMLVTDPARADKGTVTIKIRVEAKDEDSVVISYDTKIVAPGRLHKALSAIVSDDGVMAVAGRGPAEVAVLRRSP